MHFRESRLVASAPAALPSGLYTIAVATGWSPQFLDAPPPYFDALVILRSKRPVSRSRRRVALLLLPPGCTPTAFTRRDQVATMRAREMHFALHSGRGRLAQGALV